jgi:chromosome partitioning protein
MRLTCGNLKGGVGKSTSAVFLACGLAQSGRTLLVDADPQGSILGWAEAAGDGFPATVITWATRDLAKRVGEVAGDYHHIVIDTGPSQEHLLRQALAASDQLLIPIAPSLMDVRELSRTFQMVEDLAPVHPVQAHVLLTKVRAGTLAACDARAGLAEQGIPLLDTDIPLREFYSQAWGTAVHNLGQYVGVLNELGSKVTA